MTESTLVPIAPAPPVALVGAATSTANYQNQKQAGTKRKRNDAQEPSGPDSGSTQSKKARDGPKKKKANRACFHCQKAHLTCDDSRPCQRCIKRGIANSCTEGHRKKAKYLLDDEELEQLKRTNKNPQNTATNVAETPRSSTPAPQQEQPQPHLSTSDPILQESPTFEVPFDSNFPFGSEAANLEYSILSAILGNPSPPQGDSTPPPTYPGWPSSDPLLASQSPTFSSTFPTSLSSNLAASPTTAYLTYQYQEPPRTSELSQVQYPPFQQSVNTPNTTPQPLQSRYSLDSRAKSPPYSVFIDETSHGLLSPPHSNASPSLTPSVVRSTDSAASTSTCTPGSKLQSIHDRVTKPYDYTEGYHFLMKHLPIRFEKNDILRIVRALAIFRPSLIALQMPLSLDDEVFVEKCFQRSLLELEKLISFSGTPTVIWRRTGEICLVAPEFCMLTEWSMEELLGKKKYIYELFENQSVVEYWENFAEHAFENTTQSVYSHCVLLKPNGAPIPSTFCFSIRRDLFDLPSVVIGQWLPLL
ncbi:transcription activator of gluconeogenesis ERT1 [Lentinula lateritia]|uniref:Transcription activator of gluconeogenesis ERT1 n=1 Tax=Lentinula aff. lateritia TaxID=2804960 RepID=A0ACC1UCJ6_9AGAR|nr:transcription activator of gluconeogenesis ERT1 [Lentinula aff. lateritia]KAJ3853750.1 transcription activator of gluconeogenesis ERT1 [Lentinula lateritia]